jgi:hypothetical protein
MGPHSRSSCRGEDENPFSYAEIKPDFSVCQHIALPVYSLTYLSSDNVKILDHGSPTRGPPGFIWRPAAKFVKYVYTTQITQDFRHTMGVSFIAFFPCAPQEPDQNNGGRCSGRPGIRWLNGSGYTSCFTYQPHLKFVTSKFLAKCPTHITLHFVVFSCL